MKASALLHAVSWFSLGLAAACGDGTPVQRSSAGDLERRTIQAIRADATDSTVRSLLDGIQSMPRNRVFAIPASVDPSPAIRPSAPQSVKPSSRNGRDDGTARHTSRKNDGTADDGDFTTSETGDGSGCTATALSPCKVYLVGRRVGWTGCPADIVSGADNVPGQVWAMEVSSPTYQSNGLDARAYTGTALINGALYSVAGSVYCGTGMGSFTATKI